MTPSSERNYRYKYVQVLAFVLSAWAVQMASAAGPLEVIDAAGKLKAKEEVNRFVQKRLKATERGMLIKEGQEKACGGFESVRDTIMRDMFVFSDKGGGGSHSS